MCRRNPILECPEAAPLTARLGNCPEAIALKTIEATTQLRDGNIDMDQREIPRMNRQKRGVPYAQRRLEGRTDSDTFFSSVKSIRGFKCVQLFVHLMTQYLWIGLLRREKDNHGAYQDFIREVGTPNILLTDNAQSQVGAKWREISRSNLTQQRCSAPSKQNQNQSERKIGDVKRRLSYSLFASQAPLVFWCYCIQFLVTCLNVTARRRLNWRTATEALTGYTPDISHMKFAFWEKAWYYDYNHRFPESPWKPCRFVGFAEHQGDQFTYKVWTISDTKTESWEKGRELTRDIVIPRLGNTPPPAMHTLSSTSYDALQFESGQQRQHRKTSKSRSKAHRKHKADEAAKPGNNGRAQKKPRKWEARVNDDLTLCTADLTEDEDEPDITDDPAEHLIRPFAPPVPDSVSVSIHRDSRGEEEDARLMDDNPMADLDFGDPTKAEEIYNEFGPDKPKNGMIDICSHRWRDGRVELQINWDTNESTWETFDNMREDHPRATAEYIVHNNVSRKKSRDPIMNWARKVVRDTRRALRRIIKLYDFQLDESDRIYRVRRRVRGSKKKKRIDHRKREFKYGLEVPRDAKRALEIDQENGDHLWEESMKAEIDSLLDYGCFEFHPAGSAPPDDEYQKTTLRCIFQLLSNTTCDAKADW